MLNSWYNKLALFHLQFPSITPIQVLTTDVICFIVIDITCKRQMCFQRIEFAAMGDNVNNLGLNTKRQKKALLFE